MNGPAGKSAGETSPRKKMLYVLGALILLYVAPRLLGEVGDHYASQGKAQYLACQEGQAALQTAHSYYRWQGPLWLSDNYSAREDLLRTLGRPGPCAPTPGPAVMAQRLDFSRTLADGLVAGEDWQRPAHDWLADVWLGWGYPERVLELSWASSHFGALRALGALERLGEMSRLIPLRHNPGSGLVHCLQGKVEAGIRLLQPHASKENDWPFRTAYAECLLRAGDFDKLRLYLEENRPQEADVSAQPDLLHFSVSSAIRAGKIDKAVRQIREAKESGPLAEWAMGLQGSWQELYFAKPSLVGGYSASGVEPPPVNTFAGTRPFAQVAPYEQNARAATINERLMEDVATTLARATHPRAPEIRSHAAKYTLVLACLLAARWDPEAEKLFQRSEELAPDWSLPRELRRRFAFVHGQWDVSTASLVSVEMADVIALGPNHTSTAKWDGRYGDVHNYRTLARLLRSSLSPDQKMQVLRRTLGSKSMDDTLWRLTTLIVVGRWYGLDVSDWQKQLAAVRSMRQLMGQAGYVGI